MQFCQCEGFVHLPLRIRWPYGAIDVSTNNPDPLFHCFLNEGSGAVFKRPGGLKPALLRERRNLHIYLTSHGLGSQSDAPHSALTDVAVYLAIGAHCNGAMRQTHFKRTPGPGSHVFNREISLQQAHCTNRLAQTSNVCAVRNPVTDQSLVNVDMWIHKS